MADRAGVRPTPSGSVVVDDRVGTGATVLAVICGWLLATKQSVVVPYSLGLTPVSLAWYGGGLLLLLCWLAGQHVARPHRPTTLLAMGMLLATLVSSAALMMRGPTADRSTQSTQLLSGEVGMLAAVLLVMVLVRSAADLARVVQGIVVGASISAAFALVQAATGAQLADLLVLPGLIDQVSTGAVTEVVRAGAVRPQGSAGHPLELSAVLTVVFPLALGLTLSRRARHEVAWPWALASTIIGLGALATISRSAIVGITAALLVMSWRWPVRRVVVAGSAAVVGVFAAIVAGVPLVSRLADVLVGGTGDNSVGSRTSGLSYALEVLPQHWLTGQGAGTYDVSKQPVLDNSYLTRTVESGLIGLLTLVIFLGGAWCIAFAASRRSVTSPDRGEFELVNGVLGALSAIVLIALILDIGGFAQISTLMYVLVALAGSAALISRRTHV